MDDTPVDDLSLSFDEFALPAADDWQTAAVDFLGGQPFEKLISPSYEGIPIRPLYRREDTADLPCAATVPGRPPFARGATAAGSLAGGWGIAQALGLGWPADFNRALLADLQRGQTALTLLLDGPTRAGLDPDTAPSESVGRDGLSLATAGDATEALRGVYLSGISLLAHGGASAVPLLAALIARQRNAGLPSDELAGGVTADPLGVLAEEGALPLPLDAAYDQMATLADWAAAHAPRLATAAVRTDIYHDAGANAAQELACGLAIGVATLRALTERGLDANTAARAIHWQVAIGGRFFMEVAKLRAARLLWAQVVEAFGGDEESAALRLHARTARRNKTAIDPHVNMLRATTEALAAAVGGADTLCVAPFDEPLGAPDDFSRRIARNVQIILQQEAHLSQLIDPAGGSYAVETLTDQLAHEAWKLFQEIEQQGGMAVALANGFVQSSIAAVAGKRDAALAKRRDVLVGVNQFANPTEKPRPSAPPADDTLYAERVAQLAVHRAGRNAEACAAALGQLASAGPEAAVEAAIAAAEAGATLGEMATALRHKDGPRLVVAPLPRNRAAEPFEALRQKALSLTLSQGEREPDGEWEPDPLALRERVGERALPRLFLANLGPPRQHKARADFTQAFFEVGGFQVITNNGFATPDEAAAAALAAGAPAVAICSTDETYPELVPPLVAAIKSAAPNTVVILAGRPADQVEALRAAGVDEFIYLGASVVAVNDWLLKHLMELEPQG
jgi:methylmalonyl-CoA mutase